MKTRTDEELVALYGRCVVCGAPRNAEAVSTEQSTTTHLVCTVDKFNHPAGPAWGPWTHGDDADG